MSDPKKQPQTAQEALPWLLRRIESAIQTPLGDVPTGAAIFEAETIDKGLIRITVELEAAE